MISFMKRKITLLFRFNGVSGELVNVNNIGEGKGFRERQFEKINPFLERIVYLVC
jgi:hypothetical protein